MGLLKVDPDLTPRGPVMPRIQNLGARTAFLGCSWQRVCMAASRLCSECSSCWSGFPFFHCATFFSFSLTFSLHADKSLCLTCPKTPSSSWVFHLSALCSVSLLQLTLFSLLASCLRAGHTLRFLLYRSSSVQCEINTV